MTVEQKLLQFIDKRTDEVLQFTKELIAAPSENATWRQGAIAKVILDKVEQIGLNGAVVASEVSEGPNVLYRLQGSSDGPTLLYVAHTDTKVVRMREINGKPTLRSHD